MRSLLRWMPAAAAVSVATLCLGARFTWTDEGEDQDWDTCANWKKPAGACFPFNDTHNATIPSNGGPCGGPWDIDLTADNMGDLLIEGDVSFDKVDGLLLVESLAVQSLTIEGFEGGESCGGDVTLNVGTCVDFVGFAAISGGPT